MLTEKISFVKENKEKLLTVLIIILTATFFYMIGRLSCELEKEDIEIENFSKIEKIVYF